MSRNLLRTNCYFCCGEVRPAGDPHSITQFEAGAYFDEYDGLVVCDYDCSICGAKYLGWMQESDRWLRKYNQRSHAADSRPFDLSFRASFNDEPTFSDMPTVDLVETRRSARVT